MFPPRSPKTMFALGNRQPPSAASNSRTLRARIMANGAWIVSRSVSQIGIRFKATSGSLRLAKQKAVATGPRCVSRTVNSIGSRPFTLIVSRWTVMGRHWPSKRYWSGCVRIGVELEQVGLIGPQGRHAPGHAIREADEEIGAARARRCRGR